MSKYNIYIICKNEEIFNKKKTYINSKYKNKICHIQWVPAEYLKLTQCNKKLLKDLNTRYNTQKKKILAKLGCIAAHRKALLAIYSSKTNNNIVLEEDSVFSHIKLPPPPKISCYMGGWIVPPQVTKAGKEIPKIQPKNGINKIDYSKFKILMTHALFIRSHEEALKIFQTTIADKVKNYDVHLNDIKMITNFYYPPVFVQDDHVSEIEGLKNNNDKYSSFYGLVRTKRFVGSSKSLRIVQNRKTKKKTKKRKKTKRR